MKNKRKMLGLTATASLLSLSAILASCGKAVKEYTVTFKNGTETVTTQSVPEGTTASIPTELQDNAEFNGWYSDSSLTTPFDFGSAVKGDITVYANWINKYTVTFETNGGSTIAPQTVREGANATAPAAYPTKDNMVFAGWYSDAQFTTAFNFGSVITKNTTVYAKWEEATPAVETVTIVVNYNDDLTTRTEVVLKGLEYNIANPTREGYVFGGWYSDESLTTPFVSGTAVNANLTLYAKWDAATETTTYGFGEELTSWATVQETTGTKEYDNKGNIQMVLAKSYSKDGITLSSNGKNRIDNASQVADAKYITQQADITFVIKSKATITVEGIWGPTSKSGKVYLKNGSNAVYTSANYEAGSLSDVSFTKEVEAGTYTLNSDATLSISKISVSRTIEYVNVTYNSEHGTLPQATKLEKGDKLEELKDLSAEGYIFEGWYTTSTFDEGTQFDADTVVTANTTLYAKWKVYNPDNYATVTYNFGVSNQTVNPTILEKGQKLSALPTVADATGYRFVRWYTEDGTTFNINTPITESITLYAEFVQQRTVTFKYDDNTVIDTLVLDDDTKISSSKIPTAEYKYGKKFVGWFNGDTQFDFANNTVTSDLVLIAKYETQTQTNNVTFMSSATYNEGLYAEFLKYEEATTYKCYVKKSTASTYTKLDDQLVRLYNSDDNSYQYYRVDALGLAAGTYSLKVVPVINGTDVTEAQNVVENLEVIAHDRSGFAFVNGTSSGAYNEDGTLKSDAIVVYISNSNKDTVTVASTKAKPAVASSTGFNNILNAMKASKSIDKPVCIRLLGNITDPQALDKGDILVDDVSVGLTIEGVGTDATANGWGIRIKGSSNVEIRNIGFMNCDSDEGDDLGLQQDNDHIWVHNCDFFYGGPGGDADQAKGDGALDSKKSTYVTNSYNHFFDCGKCNLLGLSEGSTTGYYITYHHNWYDHSDSRHPRARYYTVHVYNNYYDGNSKYGVGVTLGASAFVENNYFRNCKYPMMTSMQGSDIYASANTKDEKNNPTFSDEAGGSIKSYGNVMVGTYTYIPYGCETYINKGTITTYALTGEGSTVQFDAYQASTRDEQVPSTVTSYKGNNTYNNFDTASSMYTYTVETAEQAKETVTKWAGRVQGGDFKWAFTEADDTDYSVNRELKSAIVSYTGKLVSVQGIEGTQGGNVTPQPTEATAEDVIALIEALPESTAVTASNKTAIEAAKAAYDALSSTEQAKVTNKAKLDACVAALASLPQEALKLTFDSKGAVCSNSTFFTLAGSVKKTADITGASSIKDTYVYSAKLDSKGSITFTLTKAATVKIYACTKTSGGKISVGKTEQELTTAPAEYTFNLEAGTYTIKQSKTESYIFYVIVE